VPSRELPSGSKNNQFAECPRLEDGPGSEIATAAAFARALAGGFDGHLRHFLAFVRATPVTLTPFPYLYLCDLFPQELFDTMLRLFPPLAVMPKAPRAVKKRVRGTIHS
jgi:hypothetical protein